METRRQGMKIKFIDCITDFGKGVIAGFIFAALIFGLVLGIIFQRYKAKEINEYVERQQIIEKLREDYANRDPVQYLDAMPDVRRAADGAADEFIRKRDEALQRFRSGLVN
jgi:hypothetical protein